MSLKLFNTKEYLQIKRQYIRSIKKIHGVKSYEIKIEGHVIDCIVKNILGI